MLADAHAVPALGVGRTNRLLLRLLADETRAESRHHENHLQMTIIPSLKGTKVERALLIPTARLLKCHPE